MNGNNRTPRYALRLIILLVCAGTVFFVGLRFFVPEGSKLTGTYDAESLLYIASAPVSYAGSESCGASNCHEPLYRKWSEGAHGAREEKSKCEVCHGPQGKHPGEKTKLMVTRGDGNLVELCLTCHRKMKARSTTGQPQVSPQEHPYPHEGVLICTQCHDPHSPGFGAPEAVTATNSENSPDKPEVTSNIAAGTSTLAASCFACHGQDGKGGFAPALTGQTYDALRDKLVKFRSGEIESAMMKPVVAGMKDAQIENLAKYFAGRS